VWFETDPGCIYSRNYVVAGADAPQLTRSGGKVVESQCHLRTFQRNQQYFGFRSAERWALIRRCLRFAAYHDVNETPPELLKDLKPLDWRIRAWLFWQMKKRGKKIHQRRTAAKMARS
jgi:hypothetical protein